MPDSPKSETQVLSMTPKIMRYLTQNKQYSNAAGLTDFLSVQATMLVAMGQALQNSSLMSLPLEM